uniref:Needs CLA4 to survive protein 3 n=1 Tax=Psilocybe cubensis TaxID=181762 RepID=A0A8H7Y0D3_PSICU
MTTTIPLQNYQRYGRQMILDGFGLPGQIKLHQASVVVVGAGGLGCPALQYLGAVGLGRLGIVDHDRVELSNLQRQILHNEDTLGMYKAESAALALKRMNSGLNIDVMTIALTADNALSLLRPYDVILDCTDNAATRYLLSDAAVALNKPLVSGAAQKFEGQLCVYNLGPTGPCYRCLYPTPPPLDAVGSCEELGVLGVVTGIIGNMQALETIKIILGTNDQTPTMLLFSALGSPPFRTIKLRQKKVTCTACSDPSNALRSITSTDYVQFCGGPIPDWVNEGRVPGETGHRIQPQALRDLLSSPNPPKIIDVRPHTEYGICSLPSSENIPLKELLVKPENYIPSESPVYIVCRLGNDSQIAAEALRRVKSDLVVKDVIGGLRAWTEQVDSNFPLY